MAAKIIGQQTEILGQQAQTLIKLDEAITMLANQAETLRTLERLVQVVDENAQLKQRIDQQNTVITELVLENQRYAELTKRIELLECQRQWESPVHTDKRARIEHAEEHGRPEGKFTLWPRACSSKGVE